MISRLTIEEVKDRANLIEIIGETVQLRRVGGRFVGLCPFHSEDTPSFYIRENGKQYHCFGCGASGNVISYIMEMRGLSFPDAVEELAARYGVEVKREGGTSKPVSTHRDELLRLNQSAFEYFRQQLENSDERIKSYVKSRSITPTASKEFGLGFCSPQWTGLTEHLRKHGYSQELMLLSGLVRRSPRGDLFDLFRGRLIFPIWIESKKIAGFGGRVIPALVDPAAQRTAPKYLNSPETEVYQKSKILYGLPQALESIRRTKTLYLVEGYVDVIGLWQVGLHNAVAPCGTAVSEAHIRRMQHLVERVRVLFDGDIAGRSAAARCFQLFLNSGIDVSAIFLPEDEDPDTIAAKHGDGTEAYLSELPSASLLDCWVDGAIQQCGAREVAELGAAAKGRIAAELASILGQIKNAVEQSELTEHAAFRLSIEESVLRQMVAAPGKTTTATLTTPRSNEQQETSQNSTIAALSPFDREVLSAVMAKKETLLAAVLKDAELCEVLHPAPLQFMQELSSIMEMEAQDEAQRKEAIKALLKARGEDWFTHWRKSYQMASDPSIDFELLLKGCRLHARKTLLKQALIEIDQRLRDAPLPQERDELLREQMALRRQLEGYQRASATQLNGQEGL
ncbi:MAG: DNA primase [Oligoflexia bacterium]|nr:DNA primase [Oligoflexia bacterium]